MRRKVSTHRFGFTLIELLVVIAIIAILAGRLTFGRCLPEFSRIGNLLTRLSWTFPDTFATPPVVISIKRLYEKFFFEADRSKTPRA